MLYISIFAAGVLIGAAVMCLIAIREINQTIARRRATSKTAVPAEILIGSDGHAVDINDYAPNSFDDPWGICLNCQEHLDWVVERPETGTWVHTRSGGVKC